MSERLYLTIHDGASRLCLLTLDDLGPSNGLALAVRSGKRPTGQADTGEMSDHQYVIRPAPEGPSATITASRRIDGEAADEFYRVNAAFAQVGTYAPLFFRRSGRMQDAGFDIPDAQESIDLGRYDPSRTMLMFGLFVGRAGKEFAVAAPEYGQLRQVEVAGFSVVVMWTFLTLPSDHAGELSHFEAAENTAHEAFDEFTCTQLFTVGINELKSTFNRAVDSTGLSDTERQLLAAATFVADGTANSLGYRRWLQHMTNVGLLSSAG